MWIRLRQIVIAAADLHRTGLDISSVLGVEPCVTDPDVATWGLKNTLWPVGTQFLEVVTPLDAQDAHHTPAGRYMSRRGGDTGYMVITQVDDAGHRRRRMAELGVRIVASFDTDEFGHDAMQLHPADTGGSFLEMDQVMFPGGDEPGGPWGPAGKAWRSYVRTDHVTAISAAELQSPDPDRLAARWADLVEIPVTSDSSRRLCIELDNATLRFVEATDGRGEGLGAIDLVATDRDAVMDAARIRRCAATDDQVVIGGLRMNLT